MEVRGKACPRTDNRFVVAKGQHPRTECDNIEKAPEMIPFWVDFSVSGLVQLSALVVAIVGWFITIFASHAIRG